VLLTALCASVSGMVEHAERRLVGAEPVQFNPRHACSAPRASRSLTGGRGRSFLVSLAAALLYYTVNSKAAIRILDLQ
jgi:hypothetical protein